MPPANVTRPPSRERLPDALTWLLSRAETISLTAGRSPARYTNTDRQTRRTPAETETYIDLPAQNG